MRLSGGVGGYYGRSLVNWDASLGVDALPNARTPASVLSEFAPALKRLFIAVAMVGIGVAIYARVRRYHAVLSLEGQGSF